MLPREGNNKLNHHSAPRNEVIPSIAKIVNLATKQSFRKTKESSLQKSGLYFLWRGERIREAKRARHGTWAIDEWNDFLRSLQDQWSQLPDAENTAAKIRPAPRRAVPTPATFGCRIFIVL